MGRSHRSGLRICEIVLAPVGVRGALVRGYEHFDLAAEQFFTGVAEYSLGLCIGGQNSPLAVGNQDAGRHGFDQQSILILGRFARLNFALQFTCALLEFLVAKGVFVGDAKVSGDRREQVFVLCRKSCGRHGAACVKDSVVLCGRANRHADESLDLRMMTRQFHLLIAGSAENPAFQGDLCERPGQWRFAQFSLAIRRYVVVIDQQRAIA
jgi:hypothetical protein